MKRDLTATLQSAALVAAAAASGWIASGAMGQTASPAGTSVTVAPAPASTSPSTSTADGTTSTPGDSQEAERLKIWDSPEMQQARAYIEDYASRSVRFRPKDAAAYLGRLERMSPADMTAWLGRFQTKQANLARSAAVAKAGRQLAIDQALSRQQAIQQSYVNMKQAQSEAALLNSERVAQQLQTGREMASARDAYRNDQAAALMHSADYSWIIDPPYYTRVVAAATLPGDLPRGDPQNFIRGDVLGPEVVAAQAAASAAVAGGAAAGAAAGGAPAGPAGGAGAGP